MSHEKSAITCPECSRRYAVPAGSIGPEGRTVRCVSCHHSWVAHPDEVRPVSAAVPAPARVAAAAEPVAAPVPPPVVQDTAPEVVEPMQENDASRQGMDVHAVPAEWDVETETLPTRRKGRGALKLLTVVGGLAAIAAAGAAGIYGRSASDAHGPSLALRIDGAPVRQRAADGSETITTRAELVNSGDAPATAPDLHATMRTQDGRVVREWDVKPTERAVAPHGSTTVQIDTAGPAVPPGPLTLDVDMINHDGR
jgi:predicted Zn finger-like uncharacterized protein